ncbi:hypothetical protein CC1G_03560 [Coprinopsis cinerea okayama7|uniref:Uncharacterized protein n=1 Tax=Coprinopsis cinerea (strain Okayama-7 / 130 / ATCC MYA-4618 / FGSC 9003) TaxID=240176 RepID=A8NCK2_COPC7|nr:hypothetical protein CC1G_03560 [Coprinopsis cinerea okayama7\|eukprot:XP_001832546.2 hypothetical protein CC1G_03560 [Coprinopsis cinerea okayama7\
MWFYASPLFRDKNAVAPYAGPQTVQEYGREENRRRARAQDWNGARIRVGGHPSSPSEPSATSDDSSHDKSLYTSSYDDNHRFPSSTVSPNTTTSTFSVGGPLSPITPPPPAYVSQPTTPVPEYGTGFHFNHSTPSDAQSSENYHSRTYGSPTPGSHERYRPSHSDQGHHSPPRGENNLTVPSFNSIRGRPRSVSHSTASSRSVSRGEGSSSSFYSESSSTSQGLHGYANNAYANLSNPNLNLNLPLGLSYPPVPQTPVQVQYQPPAFHHHQSSAMVFPLPPSNTVSTVNSIGGHQQQHPSSTPLQSMGRAPPPGNRMNLGPNGPRPPPPGPPPPGPIPPFPPPPLLRPVDTRF